MKSCVVIGMGRFGREVSRRLCEFGCEVMAMDLRSELVQQISGEVTHAVVADAKDKEVLRTLDVQDFDCAIVAVGDNLADSVLTTMNLKELKVPYIVCKARDETHRQVLEKLGADRVVIPEQENAARLARSLSSPNVLDYIELSDEYGRHRGNPRSQALDWQDPAGAECPGQAGGEHHRHSPGRQNQCGSRRRLLHGRRGRNCCAGRYGLPDHGSESVMERITARKNPLLQQVRRLLSSRKEREESGLFAADGTKLLREAIAWWPGLHTVILSDGVSMEIPQGVRLVQVPEDVMASISPMQTPQGALFLCRLPEKAPFVPKPGMVLLDGIQDPGNLGTILRTADALEIPVALLEGCADPYSHKTVRASMGAVFRSPVVQTTWTEAAQALGEAKIEIGVTALSEKARDLRQAPLSQMAVVIGSEGQGVRKEILEAAQNELIIPMNPRCESLNAAAAATIVMWQMKQ